MSDLFLKDLDQDLSLSWQELIEELRKTDSYNPYCYSSSYFGVFKNIVLSMLLGEEIILLDADFTEEERTKLTGTSDYSAFQKPLSGNLLSEIHGKNELIEALKNPADSWKITLFTSGTTGLPKKVSHGFSSITRSVRYSENNKNSVWGFAYNPTHMAGIQVFFQALLNGNSLVRLFGLSNDRIYKELEDMQITHISATPTFYRLLLPCPHTFPSVKRITSGGEKFNESTFQQLSALFPNAKITNVYASTEGGSLFASENSLFSIRSEMEGLVRIENNELLLHHSLLGRAENLSDEWYNTGDVIEIVSENPLRFQFVNRKSEMINVGGYKVNPHEVEEALLAIPGIRNARVYAKANSVLGNIICCEVVSESEALTEADLRTHLQEKLQEFKIPRIIRFVTDISTTRTGKIKRN